MRNASRYLGFAAMMIGLACTVSCRAKPEALDPTIEQLAVKGLHAHAILRSDFTEGREPKDFRRRAGADYKPSFNPEPEIPAQCWIETGYGTQNACLYCHTDYLASIGHGNATPLAEDQILYSFPEAELNHILWANVISPANIDARLRAEGIPIPDLGDTDYVRQDNWGPAFARSRHGGNTDWLNSDRPGDEFALFPALDPNHLFPFSEEDPTSGGAHGYVDIEGFVRDENGLISGWRAINFFPYGIFTPLSGSVSGIYIRLPRVFATENGIENLTVYKANLDLLERNIKNRIDSGWFYVGDASTIAGQKGFYPAGTEFAHPLHYVDLRADGEMGPGVDGVVGNASHAYEFPGTRSKRIKEMRYMYKWREVTLADLAESEDDEEDEEEIIIGREGQGWVENSAGWILAGFIEDRGGAMRTQTTEELMQCIGCHGNVGNTVDSVWSFQRKLPGDAGWREMDYGRYDSRRPQETRLHDYQREGEETGELEFFYHTVVGADLYGVMPREIAAELVRHARDHDLPRRLGLKHPIDAVFNDEALKNLGAAERTSRLLERQAIMRDYAAKREYLFHHPGDDAYYIKGAVFYPGQTTMNANIQLYRKIVLDQSYNLGKDVFGSESDHVPFTFRSDGTVRDAGGTPIPAGGIITSRPYGEDGVGFTPTGIVAVNAAGEPIDANGNPVDIETHPERAVGHVATGGTFFTLYSPTFGEVPVRKKRP